MANERDERGGWRDGSRASTRVWVAASAACVIATSAALASAQPPGGAAAVADPLAEELAPVAGGLTPEAVAAAARSRPSVRVKSAEVAAAAARVDQAFAAFFPRVTATAAYVRLSPLSLQFGSGALVGASSEGPLSAAPCPGRPGATCVVDAKGSPVGAQTLTLPVYENQYTFQASIAVPVSDYLLRLTQAHAAARHGERAKRLEREAQSRQEAANATLTFYGWVRARGGRVVAREAVTQARAHLADAERVAAQGMLSDADVLRLKAQVAAAEQAHAEAEAFAAVAEEQLRVVLGVAPERRIEIGVDVLRASPARTAESLDAAERRAFASRPELAALDETERSLDASTSAARAGYFPRLDAFADAVYQNPNQRVFPAKERFDLTWDVGARLTWVVNETLVAAATTAEARARREAASQQKHAIRDGLRVEVASAWHDVSQSAARIDAAERGRVAAEESLRVRNGLLRVGRASAVDLVDAETELARARLRVLDARVGLLAARVRLAHATGDDAEGGLR